MPTITIDGTKIDQVSKTKVLGVKINQHLSWDDHILAIKQKIAKSLVLFFRILKNMPNQVLRSLYNSLIHPYYGYCNIILLSIELHDYTGYF